MRDAEYVTRLRRHLGAYRESVLGVPAGTWGKVPEPYEHILPVDAFRLNIVEPIRESFWDTQSKKGWKCHTLFHHLSSSQGLAFNLFFPLYPSIPGAFKETRAVLGMAGDDPADLDFEVILQTDDGRRVDGTNIDTLITARPRDRTVIEIKLTESRFGPAPHDAKHLKKLEDVYRPLFYGRLPDVLLEPVPFFKDYQLYRQLAQIRRNSDDRVLLMIPRARPHLWRFAQKWCARPELGEFSGRVAVVAIEDVAAALLNDARTAGHDLRPYEAFAAKYLP